MSSTTGTRVFFHGRPLGIAISSLDWVFRTTAYLRIIEEIEGGVHTHRPWGLRQDCKWLLGGIEEPPGCPPLILASFKIPAAGSASRFVKLADLSAHMYRSIFSVASILLHLLPVELFWYLAV